MAKLSAKPSAQQARSALSDEIGRIRTALGLPLPEIIPTDWKLQCLLARSPFERQFLGLEYFAPVHRVFPCQECGEGVVLISLDGQLSTVDAIPDPDNEPFHRRWSANILAEHKCRGGQ